MRHSLVFGGGATPSLDDAKTLIAPDGSTILSRLASARGMIKRLRILVTTVFGVAHGTTSTADNFFNMMVALKDELNEAMAQDDRRGRKLPGLILRWYQIRWTDWVRKQWAYPNIIVVLDFEALWYQIDLNETLEPYFSACYNHSTADGTGAVAIKAQNTKGKN